MEGGMEGGKEGGKVAPWCRCTAALPRHAAFTFPTPSCLSSDAFDFAAFIHQCTRAALTPHLSPLTLATRALLCILHSPTAMAASSLASSPSASLLCDTPPVFKVRKTDQEQAPAFRKGRESEIASDRVKKRRRGHLEGGIGRKKRGILLIYAIAVPIFSLWLPVS